MVIRGRKIQFWEAVGTGLVFGIIYLLIVSLTSNTYFKADKNFLPYHWQKTSLDLQQVSTLINNETCYQSQRSQLACLSAIIQMAYRNHMELQFDGQLVSSSILSSADLKINLSEKDFLEKWQQYLKTNTIQFSFNDLVKKIEEITLKNEKQSTQQVFAAGLNSYLSVAKDPHTYLVPLSYFSDVVMNSSPKQKNYGFNLGTDGSKVVIKKVIADSPAALAGLRAGDQILTIEKRKVKNLAAFELSELMMEGLRDDLDMEVRRGDRILFLHITPSTTELPAVTSSIYGDVKKLGVIQVNKFSNGVCNLVANKIRELRQQLIRGLLLDLRDNSGGVIDEAGCMLSLFVGPDKEAFSIRFFANPGRKEVIYTNQPQLYTGPLMVLMNAGSASASELLAGSLRHYQRAKIAGERSYGKGSFQEGKSWEANENILIFETKGFYFLPNGETPQYVGIQPDIEIKQVSGLTKRESEDFLFPLLNPKSSIDIERAKSLGQKQDQRLSRCLSLEHYVTPAQSGDQSLSEGLEVLSCLKTSYATQRSHANF